MKPMLLTSAESVPTSKDWIYETKYDGFRCILKWDIAGVTLISRNDKELTEYFPEIVQFCEEIAHKFSSYLPLILDGEIVFLQNDYKSDFSIVQSRGRMRTKKTIMESSEKFSCSFIAFDLLLISGEDFTQNPLLMRKQKLQTLFEAVELPLSPSFRNRGQLQLMEVFKDSAILWDKLKDWNGEGMIAKKTNSPWESGKRTNLWIKVKNWRIVTIILTLFDQSNGYFNGAVFQDEELVEVTTFRHGLSDDELQTLATFFQTKGTKASATAWVLPPSICVDVACIDFDGKKLREPRFEAFRFDVSPLEVTWKRMLRGLNPIPESVAITHPDKPIWPAVGLVKDDYILYLQEVAPFFLPFLENRLLTSIRYPHGVPGESFYQKNAPDYTPSFIKTSVEEDIEYIVCNDLKTLLWLGNQLAIEFHIPFKTIDTMKPTEIVFDLDPPSVDDFALAIEAALSMKAIFDKFNLHSFVKTSGGKGLQIYIPLPKNRFTFDETRIFTEFVCRFLVDQNPRAFTIERMKKNRGNRLYLDYVQHAEGKTIVSPYSPRGNESGLIATPLEWHEVNSSLTPKLFTIPTVLERIKNKGDLFGDFYKVGENQPFEAVLTTLKELLKKK
ncbi:DNA ligase D [Ureibacillus chungkukjangi]|uniref:DNA ligase (ATP) n=1 Tax=Ureibacillus chungkukjangi TaxID=1202712 RepID=A0A318TQZ0_9BACL|nr:DNA ligase D [Ureibacillus chungkukjangi]PYF04315.1 bifunctional non-homologous end joining protein LigD [Ureibacillus chungkukjangi]